MDYKYIEQLLEYYWEGKTSLQEEAILHTFFSQYNIPEELKKYQPLFACEQEKEEPLGEAFDIRILEKIGEAPKARTFLLTERLMPLFKAAAIVAIILTLGNAAQAPWDLWDDPRDAYMKAHEQKTDSVNVLTIQAKNLTDTILVMPVEGSTYVE